MAKDKFLTLGANGTTTEEAAIATSTGVANANQIVKTGDDGYIDPSMLTLDNTQIFAASENLQAKDLINLFDDAGTTKMRKADGSSADKRAHGFVLDNVALGASGKAVLREGLITGLTGLTRGTEYFLSDTVPGGVSATPTTTTGHVVQPVGVASSVTELQFVQGPVIVRA